jgi:Tfp pilus assembly protein PilO
MQTLIKNKYKSLSDKDQRLMIVLIICVLVSGYGFWAAMLWQDMFEAEKLANRKENRIETRIGKVEAPKFDSSISEKRLQELSDELLISQDKIEKLTHRFIQLDNAGLVQKIKLKVSELADESGVKIETFEIINIKRKPGTEEIDEYNDVRQKYYNRPLVAIQASSNYFSLLAFLKGLNSLEKLAVVKHLQIERQAAGRLLIKMKIMV